VAGCPPSQRGIAEKESFNRRNKSGAGGWDAWLNITRHYGYELRCDGEGLGFLVATKRAVPIVPVMLVCGIVAGWW